MKIDISRNEFYLKHSDKVIKSICSFSENELSFYPKEELTESLKKELSHLSKVNKKHIHLFNGAEDALRKLLLFYRLSYSQIILEDFSWHLYLKISKSLNYSIHSARIKKYHESFKTDYDNIEVSLKKSPKSLVLLASPNNPTGHRQDFTRLKKIISKNKRAIFLIDLVYESLDSKIFKNLSSHENVICIGSLSKDLGLPGLRVGFAIGDVHESLRDYLGISSVSIKIAQTALEDYKIYKEKNKELSHKFLNMLETDTFKEGNFKIYASNSHFFLLETSKKISDIKKSLEKLGLKARIMTHRRINYVRFSLGNSEIIKRIKSFFKEFSSL